MLLHFYARIYFDGAIVNAADPVLTLMPLDRCDALIAARLDGVMSGSGEKRPSLTSEDPQFTNFIRSNVCSVDERALVAGFRSREQECGHEF
jgi:hypothetical protein